MQDYIPIKRGRRQARLSLGLLDEPIEDWQRRAAALRIRRERTLKQRLQTGPYY